jgi:predicted  nucleic acid-binding Zn-ribbon protein
MNATPFHQFIDFVQCEDKITACLHSQELINRDLVRLEEEKKVQNLLSEKEHASVRSLRKQIDTYELENTSLQQQKKNIERKLEHVANPKEYSSLQSEYVQVTKSLAALEENMMVAWESFEKEQESLKIFEKTDAELKATFAARERMLREHHDVFAAGLEQLRALRNQKAALVKPEWLAKYESLKVHVSNPVVALQGISCSGCFTTLPPQVQARVHHHELVPCPACQRILYEV